MNTFLVSDRVTALPLSAPKALQPTQGGTGELVDAELQAHPIYGTWMDMEIMEGLIWYVDIPEKKSNLPFLFFIFF